MSSPTARRHRVRNVLALLAVAYVAECTFVGYTPAKALMTTRVSFSPLWHVGSGAPTLSVGDTLPLETCIYDGQDMYFWVADCARRHPLLFRFENSTPNVVSVGRTGTLRALHPGHFVVTAHSMGRSAEIAGDVVPRFTLALSLRDTTLHVGDEIVVGWQARSLDGGEPPIEERSMMGWGVGVQTATSMDRLWWAYPGAVRIRARAPGHDCYRLSSYNRTDWLSVVVVDSQGLTRHIDGQPTPPERVRGCVSSGAPAVPPSVARAEPPRPAVDDPHVSPAAIRFFATEVCIDSVSARLGRIPAPSEEEGAVGRCLDAPRPDLDSGWRAADFRTGSYPSYTLLLQQNGKDRGSKARSVDFAQNVATLHEGQLRSDHWITGPSVVIQGDEPLAVGAIVDCAALHRARTGAVPPTLDSLTRFAQSHWREIGGQTDSTGCALRNYPRRAAWTRVAGPDVIVDESGRFVVHYAALADGPAVTLRPLRYGETGVVSLRYDPRAGMRRTLADRDATITDQEIVQSDRRGWLSWRFKDLP
jgi:hypothetical protein